MVLYFAATTYDVDQAQNILTDPRSRSEFHGLFFLAFDLSTKNHPCPHPRTGELEWNLWIIESSPSQGGPVGNQTPNVWLIARYLNH